MPPRDRSAWAFWREPTSFAVGVLCILSCNFCINNEVGLSLMFPHVFLFLDSSKYAWGERYFSYQCKTFKCYIVYFFRTWKVTVSKIDRILMDLWGVKFQKIAVGLGKIWSQQLAICKSQKEWEHSIVSLHHQLIGKSPCPWNRASLDISFNLWDENTIGRWWNIYYSRMEIEIFAFFINGSVKLTSLMIDRNISR